MYRVCYCGSQGGQLVDQTLCTQANSVQEDDNLYKMEAKASAVRMEAVSARLAIWAGATITGGSTIVNATPLDRVLWWYSALHQLIV
jgi:hypothetical protein